MPLRVQPSRGRGAPLSRRRALAASCAARAYVDQPWVRELSQRTTRSARVSALPPEAEIEDAVALEPVVEYHDEPAPRVDEIPVVHLETHRAVDWSRSDRGKVAARLAKRGTTIGEMSDVRELLGLPRLSGATRQEREECHLLEATPAVLAAFATVRRVRTDLTAELVATEHEQVQQARRLLHLTRSLSDLRLGELSALWAQVQVCRLVAEGCPVPCGALVEQEAA